MYMNLHKAIQISRAHFQAATLQFGGEMCMHKYTHNRVLENGLNRDEILCTVYIFASGTIFTITYEKCGNIFIPRYSQGKRTI